MNITDAELQAFVDGELVQADAARIEAAMAVDVLVAARVARERALRGQLDGAFNPVLREGVPARLNAVLEAGDDKDRALDVRISNAAGAVLPHRSTARARPRWRTPVIALAASVAALAMAQWLRPSTSLVGTGESGLVARGALAAALDHALASTPQRGDAVTIGLTFRASDGRLCRSFVAPGSHLSGLACRRRDGWQLSVLAAAAAAPGEVRQASSGMAPEVQAAIDDRLQGEVMDGAQERAARAAGWR